MRRKLLGQWSIHVSRTLLRIIGVGIVMIELDEMAWAHKLAVY